METYDAALIDLQRVPKERADELLRCSWDGAKLISGLVQGNPQYSFSRGAPAGGNPGVTICVSAHVVLPDETNARWLAAWTWQPEHDVDLNIEELLKSHEWEKVEEGVYGGRKR